MKETSELKHALVAGWFSFHGHGHATAGDLLAAELTCDWLQEAGFTFDLALDPPFAGGIDWRKARNEDYSHVVFVCGPFGKSNVTEEFMLHFEGCRIIGLNLTMNQPREVWNPFDALIERNNSTYMAIKRLIDSREMSVVMIDTRLDENKSGLCSPAEIESLLARMDMVITTRLHGTVLSLKNGVPVIAIDPGGDSLKIKRLANEIDWPMAYSAGDLDDETLIAALDFCLSTKGKQKAQNCSQLAIEKTMEVKSAFLANLLQDEGKDMSSFVINHIQRNEQRIIVEIEKSLPW
jgi:hypothetical protein